jgi:hypothetical protein
MVFDMISFYANNPAPLYCKKLKIQEMATHDFRKDYSGRIILAIGTAW